MMIVPELWREARRHPWLLTGSILLLLLVFATHLLQALALAWSLAAFVRGDAAGAVGGIGAILAIGLLRMLLTLVQGDVAARLGGRVREDLRGAAVAAVLVPERLHDARLRDGSTQLALGDGIDGTDAYVSKYIPAVMQLVVGSVVAVCLVAVLSPLIALCVAAGILLAVLGPLLWKRMLARRGFEHWDSYETLSGDLLEALRGMSTLRALGDVPATRSRLHTRSEALRAATERVMRSSLAETAITDFAVQAGVVIAAGLAVVSVMTGQPPAVEVYALLLLSSEAFRPVRELSATGTPDSSGSRPFRASPRSGRFAGRPQLRRSARRHRRPPPTCSASPGSPTATPAPITMCSAASSFTPSAARCMRSPVHPAPASPPSSTSCSVSCRPRRARSSSTGVRCTRATWPWSRSGRSCSPGPSGRTSICSTPGRRRWSARARRQGAR